MTAYYTFTCPQCDVPLDTLLGGVYVGLGPEEIRCPYCQHDFRSHRLEWTNMGLNHRIGFVCRSFLYGLVAALIGSTAMWGACIAFQPNPPDQSFGLKSRLIFALAFLTLVGLFQ